MCVCVYLFWREYVCVCKWVYAYLCVCVSFRDFLRACVRVVVHGHEWSEHPERTELRSGVEQMTRCIATSSWSDCRNGPTSLLAWRPSACINSLPPWRALHLRREQEG